MPLLPLVLARLYFRYASRLRNLRYHFQQADLPTYYALEKALHGRRTLPWLDLVWASWQYGASFSNYYALRWFKLTPAQRRQLLTTSLLYEIERQYNDRQQARRVRDKLLFNQHFEDLLGRRYWHGPELLQQPEDTLPPDRLVFKRRGGGQGKQVLFPAERFGSWQAAYDALKQFGPPEDCVCEAWLQQHPELARLNPGSVNTLRAVTWQAAGEVQIWARVLRMGVGSGGDNLSLGGLGAWVDADGLIRHPAQYLYPGRPDAPHHPLTQVPIQGFQLPFVAELDALLQQAARRLPLLACVSWDVAFTPDGPFLIEANEHGAMVIQALPGAHGLRPQAEAVGDLTQVYG